MGSPISYQWDLQPRLVEDIEHGRVEAVHRRTGEFLAEIEANDRDLVVLRLRIAQCMSACVRGTRRGGAPSEVLLVEHLASLRRLAGLKTWAQMRLHLRAYALHLADQVRPAGRTLMERTVLGMVDDMARTVERPKSLARYARDLELSSGHLSRAFGRIVGRSFRAEQLRVRDTAACSLLATTSLPVAAIARQVGLLSASQFIAAFRRSHGLTPAAYRARHGGTGRLRL